MAACQLACNALCSSEVDGKPRWVGHPLTQLVLFEAQTPPHRRGGAAPLHPFMEFGRSMAQVGYIGRRELLSRRLG